jgi:hypothetical protein
MPAVTLRIGGDVAGAGIGITVGEMTPVIGSTEGGMSILTRMVDLDLMMVGGVESPT